MTEEAEQVGSESKGGVDVGLMLRPSTAIALGEMQFSQLGTVGKVAALQGLREEKNKATIVIQKLADRIEKGKGRRDELLKQAYKDAWQEKADRIEGFLRKEGAKGVKIEVHGDLEYKKGGKHPFLKGHIDVEGGSRSYSSDPLVFDVKAAIPVDLKDILKDIEKNEELLEKASNWLNDIRQKMADLPDLRDQAEAELIMKATEGRKEGKQLKEMADQVRANVLRSVSANAVQID
jgi:hypothetical protein